MEVAWFNLVVLWLCWYTVFFFFLWYNVRFESSLCAPRRASRKVPYRVFQSAPCIYAVWSLFLFFYFFFYFKFMVTGSCNSYRSVRMIKSKSGANTQADLGVCCMRVKLGTIFYM